MQISNNFNRFIFGVVLEDLRRPNIVLKFDNPKFQFRTSQISKESLRNLLKYLDLNYPRDDQNEPLSYTKLTSKQMTEHIEFIEQTAGFSGVELKYIADEWQRLINATR